MKLQCDVEVINRMLPTFGVRNKGRGCRALLSIGKHVDRTSQRTNVYLLICTARDRSGAKYKLKENIEKFFTGFVDEGKATVRLKEPAVDVCMSKADAAGLKSFLSAARLAHRGGEAGGAVLSALAPVRARDVEKPKTKLAVTSRKDYPLTSGFPPSLEQLQVSYCSLSRVDMRMLTLRWLRRLDLSNNHIKKLPVTVGDLGRLAELVLRDNHLESFGAALCLSTLQSTLQHLDLSRNRLRLLPACFCRLQRLVTLRLDHNTLAALPPHVGRLTELRSLSATHNRLAVLPADFRRLSLENLDLFGNPFTQPNPLDHSIKLTFPLALQELGSRAVLNHRIPYGPRLLPFQLCGELDLAEVCECGGACVSSHIQTAVSLNLHLVSLTVVLVDDMGGTEAPVRRSFCSLTCYCRFLDGSR